MKQQEKAWQSEEAAANMALEKRRAWLKKYRGIVKQRMTETPGVKREASSDLASQAKVAKLNSTESFSQIDLVKLQDSQVVEDAQVVEEAVEKLPAEEHEAHFPIG